MLAALLELSPSGVEQVDRDGETELAVYGAPGELPELAEGEAEVGGVRVTVVASHVPDDWSERWKRFHVPVVIGGRLCVRPPWGQDAVRPGVVDLVIDPGRAFGTGGHPSTRLALELLLEVSTQRAEGSFCDLGCGSGIIAIAAARLGFAPVTALDADRLAIEATVANARENGVRLERVERSDLRRGPPPAAETVAANLTRGLLLEVAGRLEHAPRVLVASGLLVGEADEVAAAFAPLRERRRVASRGWSALLLER